MHAPPATWINFTGAVVMVAFAAWVALLKPRTRVSVAFAAFAVGFGGYFGLSFAPLVLDVSLPAAEALGLILLALWIGGVAGVGLLFPRTIGRQDGVALLAAGTVVATVGVVAASLLDEVRAVLVRLAIGTMISVFLLFALRFRREPDPADRRGIAIVGAAVGFYGAYQAGAGGSAYGSPLAAEGPDLLGAASIGVAMALGIAAWVAAAIRGPDGPFARNVVLVSLGIVAYGLVTGALGFFTGGITRVAAVLVLGYAILRHQILGIDVKVRWAISRGTIAAVFIAVFFVASEAAQQYFGETLGSAYVGILAAGALVFAIAPLSRFADRFAEKAVPVAAAPASAPGTGSRREMVFLNAARLALRGGLTRDEEVHLAELAEELGIGAGRAASLLREAERDARPGVG